MLKRPFVLSISENEVELWMWGNSINKQSRARNRNVKQRKLRNIGGGSKLKYAAVINLTEAGEAWPVTMGAVTLENIENVGINVLCMKSLSDKTLAAGE